MEDNFIVDSGGQTAKCNSYMNQIQIHSGQPESAQKECLLHEIIETLNSRLELGLEHHQICVLGETLNQVLSENLIYD